MAELTNCKVSTEYNYNSIHNSEKSYHIKIEVKIPGGVASYQIPSTEEINSSLEKAISLLPNTK